MSHIFISYAHADTAYRDKLTAWLLEKNFPSSEIWYDSHIEGGNNWRDDIASALDEAYALVIIVTANSVKSVYCTYEWAYGLGQGIPILPVTFDNINIADVPTPLLSKQFIDCRDTIPDSFKEQIRRFKSVPPPVAAINRRVYEAVYDTHRRFFILGWIGGVIRHYEDDDFQESVWDYFISEAVVAQQSLETLMLEQSHAFSRKQYRLCWNLVDFLKEFGRLRHKSEDYLQKRLFSQFDSTWLPAFEYFEGDGWWRKGVKRYFDWDIGDEHNRMEILAEMTRMFPMFNASDANLFIGNVWADQKSRLASAADGSIDGEKIN
jgi:hypothetical protein